jgi:O-acetyl-ADP-ribose deacetylase
MQWTVQTGDILEIPADVLICSANVFLNLSGGVGGAFLLRYGLPMQTALHQYLVERGCKHVPRGTVVRMPSCGSPYRCVLHAVAIDAAYESSSRVVEQVVRECLEIAVEQNAKTIALTALATGYGKLPVEDFAAGLRPLVGLQLLPLEQVVVVVRSDDDAAIIRAGLGSSGPKSCKAG